MHKCNPSEKVRYDDGPEVIRTYERRSKRGIDQVEAAGAGLGPNLNKIKVYERRNKEKGELNNMERKGTPQHYYKF